MKAISLWQPWAHLIAIGAKRYETRSWKTTHRGPMAIHAGSKWTVRMALQCYEEPFFRIMAAHGVRFPARCDYTALQTLGLDFGAVVAVADLVDVIPSELVTAGKDERAFGDFSHGRWAWQYENVRRLERPILATGRQSVFDLDPEVADRIAAQLRGLT